jgi:hypothetical protein
MEFIITGKKMEFWKNLFNFDKNKSKNQTKSNLILRVSFFAIVFLFLLICIEQIFVKHNTVNIILLVLLIIAVLIFAIALKQINLAIINSIVKDTVAVTNAKKLTDELKTMDYILSQMYNGNYGELTYKNNNIIADFLIDVNDLTNRSIDVSYLTSSEDLSSRDNFDRNLNNLGIIEKDINKVVCQFLIDFANESHKKSPSTK